MALPEVVSSAEWLRRSSPYHGALEIHSYCETFVGSLAHLERVIDCVRSQPD
jgi:hypothetical protein